jgi:hypothetical protein
LIVDVIPLSDILILKVLIYVTKLSFEYCLMANQLQLPSEIKTFDYVTILLITLNLRYIHTMILSH